MFSVREWAKLHDFEYVFIDDRLFDYVPDWLEVAKEFLSNGYERTIWVDADVLVFNPEQFKIEVEEEYAFCREVWLRKQQLLGVTNVSYLAE